MNDERVEDALEYCLQRLENGENLEQILAQFPSQADDLRGLLAAAQDTRSYARGLPIPSAAQNGSRSQFLTAAAGMKPARQGFRFSLFHLRLATSSLIIIGILMFALLGTGFASANSLPGDVFYPVKLMVEQIHVNLVQDAPYRMELERNYDSQRIVEIEELNQLKRREEVTFSGYLEQSAAGEWNVGDIQLSFPANFPLPTQLIGAYIQVEGYILGQVVEVQSLQPRQMQWSGTLQSMDNHSWQIGGLPVLINSDTKISGSAPQIGAKVQVSAIMISQDRYLALSLEVAALKQAPRNSSTPSDGQKQRAITPSPEKQQEEEKKEGGFSATPAPKNQPTDTDSHSENTKPTSLSTEVEKNEQRTVQPTAAQAATAVKTTPWPRTSTPTLDKSSDEKSNETKSSGGFSPTPTKD